MKRILSFYVCFAICMALFAQATDLTIDNQTPGGLSSKISQSDRLTVENLKVTGYVNLTDLRFIGSLMENRNLHGCVDLSEVYVVGNKDNYMGKGSFKSEGTVNRLILPKTLEELENCLVTSSYPSTDKYLHVDTLVFAPENMTFVNGSFFSGSVDDQIIGVPNHLIIGEHITTIAEKAFYKNLGLQSVKIQGTQIKVENGAFTDCSDLQTIDIHGKFKTVGDFAFRGTNITKLDMDKLSDVEYLGDGAFDCPLWLDTLYVPEKIEYFYENSFTFNNKAHVFFGKKIKELSGSGFWHSGLNLHFKSSTPPKYVSYYDSYTFYVPKGATDAYKAKVCINGHQATIIEENPLEGINIATQKVKLEIGETQKVIPTFIPADADDLTLEWSSNEPSIATVDADGIVSGVVPGTTTIIATSVATGVQGSCEVTVIQHATDIQMETSEVTMTKLGETMQLNVTVLPENTTDKTVKWSSSNPSICTVTASGKIVAMGYGDAVIMAVTNDGEIPATCVVKVARPKYKLTYMVDGEEYKSYEVEWTSSITPETAPTKEGYDFSGWNQVPATMPEQDVTITGSFIVKKYKLIYKVDGEEYNTYEVEYGGDITAEAEPKKEGFNFSGWSEIPATMPAHDVTIIGSFTKAKYKLAYIVDGVEYQSDEHEAGESISLILAPEKDNQMFVGWSMEMPVGDVTLTAIYVPVNSIDAVRTSSDSFHIFTPDGIRHDGLQKGVNILRYSDGTEKKVIIQ